MKILFFSDTYLPNRDGVVTAMLGLKAEFEKKGNEMHIFTSGSRKDKKSCTEKNVVFFASVPFLPYPQYKIALFPHIAQTIAKKIKPDMIHSHALATMAVAAGISAKNLDVPSVATFHTKITDATHYVSKNRILSNVLQSFGWAYFKWLFAMFDLVTVPSAHSKKELESHGIRCIVVPNGVDTDKFKPSEDKKTGELPKNKTDMIPRALFVGRIVKEKNIDFLVKVAQAMKKESNLALFVIAGKGPALEHYMKTTDNLGLSKYFNFIGFVEDAELPELYRSCDCLVQPSKFETQGLSVLEAMACSKPAIVLKGYATDECIEEGKNGFALPENPKLWADAIFKCAKNTGAYAKNARETAMKYSLAKTADKMLEAYAEAKKIHAKKSDSGKK